MSNTQQGREALSYFMSEYKNDWEWAYSSYLEKRNADKKTIFRKLKDMLWQK
tara:strand:- start:32 stop:187 length:156 start_codon:yes stop_codon:yes gene_type:complete